jgi:glucose-1-phosphate cytidylyltransferase
MIGNRTEIHQNNTEPWRVTLVDTGEKTMTGGRLKRVRNYLGDEDFCFTYGDGVADVDVGGLIAFHRKHRKSATVTAVQPPGRYGALDMSKNLVRGFMEKPQGDGGWINGGFFVLSPQVIDRIAGDNISWEIEPLTGLARDGELMAFEHKGFWQPMDTLREKQHLEELWASGKAPWKTW